MVLRQCFAVLLLLVSCTSEPENDPSKKPVYDPAANLYVTGTMVDIREVRANAMLYPQNDNYSFAQTAVATLGEGTLYATTLRERQGVEKVSADRPTRLRIAMAAGINPGGAWVDEKTDFQVGSLRFRIYSRGYETPGEWVNIPSGKPQAATLLFGRQIAVNGVLNVPGTTIARVTELRKRNITNPSILILPNGNFLVGSSGPDPTGNTYFLSNDRGVSWKKISNPAYMNFCKSFIRPQESTVLYEVGISDATRGNIVIRSSSDYGTTWTPIKVLFRGDYHGAPTPFVEHKGRIWHAMGTAPAEGKMGIAVLSIPTDADPMEAANWTLTNVITGNASWLAGNAHHVFNEWQEGCIVVGPNDKLEVVVRIDDSIDNDLSAVVGVTDERTITFNPGSGFYEMPGGGKKFTIHYDRTSQKYWTLANPCYEQDQARTHSGWYSRRINPIFLRSRLVLCSSTDLRRWQVEKEVISSNNCFFHGFQYTDWAFDGNDIVVVSRTAFAESRGLPNRQHDANFLTFHSIRNFRSLGFETQTIEYDQL